MKYASFPPLSSLSSVKRLSNQKAIIEPQHGTIPNLHLPVLYLSWMRHGAVIPPNCTIFKANPTHWVCTKKTEPTGRPDCIFACIHFHSHLSTTSDLTGVVVEWLCNETVLSGRETQENIPIWIKGARRFQIIHVSLP